MQERSFLAVLVSGRPVPQWARGASEHLFWVHKNTQQWKEGTLDRSRCRDQRVMQAEHGICRSPPRVGPVFCWEFSFLPVFDVAHSFLLYFFPLFITVSHLPPPLLASSFFYSSLFFFFNEEQRYAGVLVKKQQQKKIATNASCLIKNSL